MTQQHPPRGPASKGPPRAPAGRARRLARGLPAAAAFAALAGCALAPPYEVPATPDIAAFKEAPGWVPARADGRWQQGPWWEGFDDPVLADLQRQVVPANQNVAAAVAAYDQARALLREQRASLFPVVSLGGGATRSGGERGGEATAQGGTAGGTRYQASIGASWEPDLWGRLRGSVTAADAGAQASQADLAAAGLAAQGELALAYIALRAADAQMALLDETLAGYERALQINRNRYEAGVVARTDVLQAQTQLANAQADRLGLQRQRAQAEHAIAVLVGQAPARFALPPAAWQQRVPQVPPSLPSTLLLRRPDIVAAERRVAAANQNIGIARSAYFPSLALSASYGLGASRVGDLFSASAALWSLGLQAAQTLFDAGAREARVAAARAAHAGAVARYRQTVLAAFQDVEDQLAAVRVLEQQAALREQAARAANDVETQVGNRYRAGQVGYTEVVTAQVSALNARRAWLQNAADRQTSAVALIQALGGGWGGLE